MKKQECQHCMRVTLVAGWPGLDKGILFLVLHLWNSHTQDDLQVFSATISVFNTDPAANMLVVF